MELKHLYTQPGDVVVPWRGEWGEWNALITFPSDESVYILPDTADDDHYVVIHHSQIDDLIEALKIMKENKNV